MSFTQNVFHPRLLPAEGQYVYIYGSKGAVSLMGAHTLYRLSANAQPVVIGEKAQPDDSTPTSPRSKAPCSAALRYPQISQSAPAPPSPPSSATRAMTSRTVVEWSSMGVAL